MLLMNETDRPSVGLLFHENIIDVLKEIPNEISIPFLIAKVVNGIRNVKSKIFFIKTVYTIY